MNISTKYCSHFLPAAVRCTTDVKKWSMFVVK
jgi:hypothetical protein